MRWRDILNERGGTLDSYSPMFSSIYPDGNIPTEVERKIKEIRRAMVRKDRIVWMLRWYRVDLVLSMIAYNSMTPDELTHLRTLSNDAIKATGARSHIIGPLEQARYAMSSLGKFSHWSGVQCAELKELRFSYQMPSDLIPRMGEIEKTWIQTRDGLVELAPNDKKLIDFGNGWAWFVLDRGACDVEGNAMGHCGNVPSERKGDRLLSLRKHITKDVWSPHLTFILHHNGYLGEMKGRGNLKPTKQYHEMIATLLEHPKIKGIIGGGYDPQNNFAIDHLPADKQEHLKKTKPGFETFDELVKQGKTKEVKEMMSAKISKDRVDEIEGFLDANTAIIGSYGSVDQLIAECWPYENLFSKLEEYFSDEIDGDETYKRFFADYYYQTFREYWYNFIEYKIHEIYLSFDDILDGPAQVCLSVDDIENQSRDEDSSISDDERLDTMADYSSMSWSDVHLDGFEDEIQQEIVHCVMKNENTLFRSLVNLIINHYVEDVEDVEDGITRTQRHRDQYEFDLGDGFSR